MNKKFKNKINTFFFKGHKRSILIKKNIIISLLLKGLSMVISFALVPITINYINPTQYGLWLTLSSIIGWLNFFDVGLANGLKNKLAETTALGQNNNSKKYISTTYAILSIIAAILLIAFSIINPFLKWVDILNFREAENINLNNLVLAVFGIFCVQFTVQVINPILLACHAASIVSLISFIGQLISSLIIYLLSKGTTSSLIYIVWVFAGVPVIIQSLASLYLFKHRLKELKPSIKFIDFKYVKDLLQVGGVFFFIQIGALILLQTDNILIIRLFGPNEVTTFNIAFKLYSAVTMVFTIVITPFWSAFTDAYVKNDFFWVKSVLKKMKLYWLILAFFTILLFFCGPFVYKFWLKDSISLPRQLSIAMVIWVLAYSWQTMYVYFLNGAGKIRLQLYLIIFTSLINIPLAIILTKFFGLAGITLSNALIFIFLGIVYYIQAELILNNKAKGIFNK